MRLTSILLRSQSISYHLASTPSPEVVSVNGWVRTIRKQKHVSFVALNDGSSHRNLQAVIPNDLLDKHNTDTRAALGTGASVRLDGKLTPKKGGRASSDQGDVELQVESLKVLGTCDGQTYPIQAKEHSLPFLRRNAHLRGRTSLIATMLRLRSQLTTSCYTYFAERGYTNTTMPLTTSSDCEGAGETFSLTHGPKPFYDRPAYLSVSGQLHLEAMCVGAGLGKAWHLAPAFRAERSDTNRHLNEFWMCEAELAFTEKLDDVMQVVETLVKHLAIDLTEGPSAQAMRDVLPQGWDTTSSLVAGAGKPWERISFTSAIAELQAVHTEDATLFQHAPDPSHGLRSEHERWLAAKYGPTFVTDYPSDQKPFYMRANPVKDNGAMPTVACFDLLVPRLGELVGGSLREERLDRLEQAMTARGMKVEDYDWYLDLRRFGSVKHGGFGLGWERLVSWLLGIDNVRECIAFPRGSEGSRF